MTSNENPRQDNDETEKEPYTKAKINKIMSDIFTDRSSSEDEEEKETWKTIKTSTGHFCKRRDKWMREVDSEDGKIQCAQCYRKVFEAAGVCQRGGVHKPGKEEIKRYEPTRSPARQEESAQRKSEDDKSLERQKCCINCGKIETDVFTIGWKTKKVDGVNGIVCSQCYAAVDADREGVKHGNEKASTEVYGSREDINDNCIRKIMQEWGNDGDKEIES